MQREVERENRRAKHLQEIRMNSLNSNLSQELEVKTVDDSDDIKSIRRSSTSILKDSALSELDLNHRTN